MVIQMFLSFFAWTKAPQASVKQRQETSRNQSCTSQLYNHNVLGSIENTSDQQQHLEVNEQLVPENVTSDENTTVNNVNDIPMSSCNTGINVAHVNVATSTDPVNQSVDATTNTYPVINQILAFKMLFLHWILIHRQ